MAGAMIARHVGGDPHDEPAAGIAQAATVQAPAPAPAAPDAFPAAGGEVTPEASDRYLIQGEHGRGGQARVLLALDRHVGREVAWKELAGPDGTLDTAPPTGGDDGDPVARRFLREARITAGLEHPNIVPVYEIGRRADGKLYYTMRLVRGRTLEQKLRECRDLGDRLKLLGSFWDLCNAMAFAHDRGVIHRDLKPGNIMVGEFGETVVLDWGLAKVRGKADIVAAGPGRDAADSTSSSSETVAGSAMGTPSYMSPEQAAGRIETVDERSDVWGLGAVLYEILAGRPPFEGRSAQQVVGKILAGEPVRPVAAISPKAPAELAAVAARALERDPARRYANARDLCEDVSAYMTGGRVRAHAYGSWELLRRFAARNRATLAAAAAVLVAIVVALVLVSIAYRDEAAARRRERGAHLEAEYHLAQAHAQQAERLLAERRMLSARIYALASLVHNPAHPTSLDPDFSFVLRRPQSALLRLDALSIAYETAHRQVRGLRATMRASDPFAGMNFSLDGARLAAVDGAGWLHLWDSPGREVARLRSGVEQPLPLAFAPDGRRVAVAGRAGTVRLFEIAAGEPARDPATGDAAQDAATGGAARDIPTGQAASSLAFTPDGSRLVVGHPSGAVDLWDSRSGAAAGTIDPPHGSDVRGLGFSPDGRWLATASWDRTARIRDAATGRLLATLAGHTDSVYEVAFSPDSTRLATAGYDGTVRLWEVPGGRLLRTLEAGRDAIYDACFSSDGRTVAGGGADGVLRLWDAASGQLRMAVEAHREAMTSVVCSADGRLVATGSLDQTVRLWAVSADDGLVRLEHPDSIYGVEVSTDGAFVATACWDGIARLWDARSGALVVATGRHGAGLWGVAVSHDGTLVATAGDDGTARLWDARSGAGLRELRGHEGRVFGVAFSPDDRLLATSSRDRTARLWDVGSGAQRTVLRDHGDLVHGVAFSPDGAFLATTSFDRAVRVWDVASGVVRAKLTDHGDRVSGLAFSQNGRLLATSGKDRVAIVRDTAGWRPLGRFAGHAQWVNRVALSRDGRLLATAGDDRVAIVWEVATGRPLLRLRAPEAVQDVEFQPDGRGLVIAFGASAVAYPLDLPPSSLDARASLQAAEADAGLKLDGFRLDVAP